MSSLYCNAAFKDNTVPISWYNDIQNLRRYTAQLCSHIVEWSLRFFSLTMYDGIIVVPTASILSPWWATCWATFLPSVGGLTCQGSLYFCGFSPDFLLYNSHDSRKDVQIHKLLPLPRNYLNNVFRKRWSLDCPHMSLIFPMLGTKGEWISLDAKCYLWHFDSGGSLLTFWISFLFFSGEICAFKIYGQDAPFEAVVLNRTSGEGVLRASGPVDCEIQKEYTFIIQAYDCGAGPSGADWKKSHKWVTQHLLMTFGFIWLNNRDQVKHAFVCACVFVLQLVVSQPCFFWTIFILYFNLLFNLYFLRNNFIPTCCVLFHPFSLFIWSEFERNTLFFGVHYASEYVISILIMYWSNIWFSY